MDGCRRRHHHHDHADAARAPISCPARSGCWTVRWSPIFPGSGVSFWVHRRCGAEVTDAVSAKSGRLGLKDGL